MVSIVMRIALEARGLSKRFVVGVGSCLASAAVLRGVDLVVQQGEAVAITGPAASGKSTLLLALAGLVSIDDGELQWFGEVGRAAALRRTLYHISSADLLRQGVAGEPHVHLIDVRDRSVHVENLERWIASAVKREDAVILGIRDEALATRLASRVLTLSAGFLHDRTRRPRVRTRVAEGLARALIGEN
jgi:ABC-type transport system involved in cytochrome c biogenesis ATPase subunit